MGRYAGIGPGGSAKTRANYSTGRGLTGKSRTQQRIDMKLGRIPGDAMGQSKRFRDDDLDKFDKYLCNEQYDQLMQWDAGDGDTYIPLRQRKPRVIYNLPKRIVNTVAAKLLGDDVFPRLHIEDDPDASQFINAVAQAANLKFNLLHAVKKALGCGSSFLRFYVVGSMLRLETFDSKYCYPQFDDEQQLEQVEIRYVFEDDEDRDERGNPIEKWFRMMLTRDVDIMYDNPRFLPGSKMPDFQEIGRAEHDLGFVQGQWLRTSYNKHRPDGCSLLEDVLDLIDSINYSLSQADQAVAYAQEPQLAVTGLDVDDLDELIKSSTKAWNLGREGAAEFVEGDLNGITRGMELRDKTRQAVTDVARVVILDPEKIVGSAQSAKAMEVLHGPLVELISELRQYMGPQFQELLTKLSALLLILNQRGANEVISMPAGWQPESLNITLDWPQVFAMTMQDLQAKLAVAVSAANAQLISKDSLTRWVCKDFGIENPDEELQKIAAQPPPPNAFGGF